MKVYINLMSKNVFLICYQNIKFFLSIYFTISYEFIFYRNKIEFKIENEIITSIDIIKEFKLLTSLNPNLLELDKKLYRSYNKLFNKRKNKKNRI